MAHPIARRSFAEHVEARRSSVSPGGPSVHADRGVDMGMFKDMKNLRRQAKDVQKQTGAKRPGLRDSLAQANAAMAELNAQVQTQAHLAQNGTATTAVVQAVRPTQQPVNYMPVVEYDLVVALPDEEATVSISQPTPHVSLAAVQPGATVNVLVDPQDPQTTMLNFA